MKTHGQPVIVGPGDGPVHQTPFGDRLWWKAGAETTGGYSLHERVAPPGSASTAHAHQGVSEGFYVIEGEIEFTVAGGWVTATPGTFVVAPNGVQHAWRNTSSADARVLVLFSPGVALGYFEEIDRLTKARADKGPDPSAFAAAAEEFGLD